MLPLSPGFEGSSSLRAEHLWQTPSAGRSAGAPEKELGLGFGAGAHGPVYPQPGGARACTWSAGPSSRAVLAVPGTRGRAVGAGVVRLEGQPAAQGLSSLTPGLPITSFCGEASLSPRVLLVILCRTRRLWASFSFFSWSSGPTSPASLCQSPGRGLRERDGGWAAGTCAGQCFGRRLCLPWQSLRSVNLVVTRSQSQHTDSLCASRASGASPVEFSRNVVSSF